MAIVLQFTMIQIRRLMAIRVTRFSIRKIKELDMVTRRKINKKYF